MSAGDFGASQRGSGFLDQRPSNLAPEEAWRPRTAWLCSLTLVLLEFTISTLVWLLFRGPEAAAWLDSHKYSVQACLQILRFLLWLSISYAFSGARSPTAFAFGMRLNQLPTLGGWAYACIALGLSLLDRYGGARGLTSPNPVGHGFYREGGGLLVYYVLYVVSLGPFFEEVVLRGLLYRAFRRGYGPLRSTAITVGVGIYFHWDQVTRSLWTPLCLISLWILLCMAMEWTGSIWNCVLSHAIYNAAQVLKWPVYGSGMIICLMLCVWFWRHAVSRRESLAEGRRCFERSDEPG